MPQFVVEVFTSRSKSGELAATERRARAAANRVSRPQAAVRYVQAIYVPDDETCFYLFRATSAELVQRASVLAGLGRGRIVEARDGHVSDVGNRAQA